MTRHRTDPVSLVFGALFVTLAIAAWTGALRLTAALDLRWLWPVLLIVGGLALLAGATRGRDPGAARDTTGDAGDTAGDAGWESPGTDG